MVDCKLFAYNIKIRAKNEQTNLSPSMLYLILSNINKMPYERKPSEFRKSRLKNMGEFSIAMDFENGFQELNDVDNTYTKIDFILGRESRELFPVKNKEGDYESLDLPEDKNLCFKTHGSFIFQRVNNQWGCILLLERRYMCTGIGSLTKYLKLIDDGYTVICNSICTKSNFLNLLIRLKKVKSAIIKNHVLEFNENDGMGTLKRKFSESGFKAKKIELELDYGGDTPLEKVKHFVRKYTGNKGEIDNNVLKDFINSTELVLLAQEHKDGQFKTIDLFKDLLYRNIRVDDDDEEAPREISSQDFFYKLNDLLKPEEIQNLFGLAMKDK